MDIKEYIASGIIERYVFDSISSQERREVECMSHIYPAIEEEVKKLQLLFEKIAIKTAERPSSNVKSALFDKISNLEQDKGGEETKVIALKTQEEKFKINKFSVAASAAMVILVVTFYLGNSLIDTQDQLAIADGTTLKLNTKLDDLSEEASSYKNHLDFLKDIDTKMVAMNGTEKHPDMLANIYWNKSSEEVMLDIKILPQNPDDKQYQLWAIVDGKPLDMGVFDVDKLLTLRSMKSMKEAQAFAVTLEPRGGSVSPTLEEMYVLGNA